MANFFRNRAKGSLLAFPLLLALGGCSSNVDLVAVRKFSDQANAASEKFPVIADDFYGACLRQASYLPLSPLSLNDIEKLRDLVDANFPSLPDPTLEMKMKEKRDPLLKQIDKMKNRGNPNKRQNPWTYRGFRRSFCDARYNMLGKNLTERHSVLFAYIKALGALANDSAVDYSKNVDALGSSIQNVSLSLKSKISDEDVKAGTNIANAIITAAQTNYRREKLKSFLTDHAEVVDEYINLIKPDIELYKRALKAESTSINAYYQFAVSAELFRRRGLDKLIERFTATDEGEIEGTTVEESFLPNVVLQGDQSTNFPYSGQYYSFDFVEVDRRYQDTLGDLRKRREAADAYDEILTSLQQANFEFSCLLREDKTQQPIKSKLCPVIAAEKEKDKSAEEILRTTAVKYYLDLSPKVNRMYNNLNYMEGRP